MRYLLLALLLSVPQGQKAVQPANQPQPNEKRAEPPARIIPTSPSANDRIADYTLWLMLFTGALVGVGGFQFVLMRKQNSLMSRQYVAMFRPRLSVRAIRLTSEAGNQSKAKGSVVYVVVNNGASTARITRRNTALGRIGVGDPLPIDRQIDADSEWLSEGPHNEFTLPAGSTKVLTHEATVEDHPDRVNDPLISRHDLVFIGWITYADDSGTTRNVGFARRYNNAIRRFEVIEDSDHEYAD